MATVLARGPAHQTSDPVAPARAPRRFTVSEYHQMIHDGVVREGERVELIHGLILNKMPINPPHTKAVRRLGLLLSPLVRAAGWVDYSQQPITLSDSEPEPDFYAATGPESKYDDRHAGPREVGLVVEVADSSLDDDLGPKLALYATARIPIYWVVNIPHRRVEVYSLPRGGKSPTYRKCDSYVPGQNIPVVLAGQTAGDIPVSELLP